MISLLVTVSLQFCGQLQLKCFFISFLLILKTLNDYTFAKQTTRTFHSFKTVTVSYRDLGMELLCCPCTKITQDQLWQLCTARTAWSESDQAVRTVHSCNSWWLALLWSDSVIKLVSVLFGKCTTLVVTKCWPMVIRQPCGDQWKAEKLGAFWRWPITRCLIKSDSSSLIIEHTENFALSGNSHGPCIYLRIVNIYIAEKWVFE